MENIGTRLLELISPDRERRDITMLYEKLCFLAALRLVE
jgi:hypothetical protein